MVEVVTVVLKWMVTVMFFSKIYRKLEIIEVISVRGADSFVIWEFKKNNHPKGRLAGLLNKGVLQHNAVLMRKHSGCQMALGTTAMAYIEIGSMFTA